MTLRSKLLIAVAAVALAGMPALAGHEKGEKKGHEHHDWFGKMDADGDGAVSREEAAAARKDHFSKADGDGDGAVTLEEMKAHHAKMEGEKHDDAHADKHFKSMDGDGDGKITMAEFDATSRFDELDADKDGKITKAEAEAHKAKHTEEHKHGQ